MLIRNRDLDGIREGRVTLAFRRWRKPTVKSGGSLKTAAGELQIQAIDEIAQESITEKDARLAGHATRESLLKELLRKPEGQLYRITFGPLRPDPRTSLRSSVPGRAEVAELLLKLQRMDARSDGNPWTRHALELLEAYPGTRAGDLCERIGQEKMQFKRNVRKLKNLGLTISLGTGYRLSPRGEAVLSALKAT